VDTAIVAIVAVVAARKGAAPNEIEYPPKKNPIKFKH
jgi:hypothetical protein